MTDQELIEKIVDIQFRLIQQQERFRDQPLANPGLSPDQRKELNELWQEAIGRDLNITINKRVYDLLHA